MTPEKITAVADLYIDMLRSAGVTAKRIRLDVPLMHASQNELESHALYLAVNIREYIVNNKLGKANRHLASLQTILSFVGFYSINDLKDHNRT